VNETSFPKIADESREIVRAENKETVTDEIKEIISLLLTGSKHLLQLDHDRDDDNKKLWIVVNKSARKSMRNEAV